MSAVNGLSAARFANAGFAEFEDVKPGTIAVLGVPVDASAPRRPGTAAGPLGIREASHAVLQPYLASPSRTVTDIDTGRKTRLRDTDILLDIGDLTACNPWTPAAASQVAALVAAIAARQATPLLLGGDDRIADALLRGLSAEGPPPACLVLSNKLLWAFSASDAPMFVGTNGLQAVTNWDAARNAGGTVLSAEHIHTGDTEAVIKTITAFARDKERIACCLDLEILDSGHAAGTPDINVGGLTPEQLTTVLSSVSLAENLVGIAAVNTAPALDPRGLTEFAAAEALFALLGSKLFEKLAK